MLGLAHASNELTIFSKLAYIAMNTKSDHPAENSILSSQTMTYLFVYVGKCFETYELLRTSFLSDKDNRKYQSKLDNKNKMLLKDINTYFSKKNRLYKVRNKLGNHYSIDYFKTNLDAVPDDEDLDFFLTDLMGNSHFFGADQVMLISFLHDLTGHKDVTKYANESFEILKDTYELTHKMQSVITDLIVQVLVKYIPDYKVQPYKPKYKKHPPQIEEISIPFFAMPPKT